MVGPMRDKNRAAWYVGGLHFECVLCGRCCSGPAEGYIWVSGPEIERIADFLKMSGSELRRRFLRRVGLRTSVVEHCETKDCIFLQENGGLKRCLIYEVRPAQCRNWPFWPGNLTTPDDWNRVAQKCRGVNRGRLYGYEDIQKIKNHRRWWKDGGS